VNKKQNGEKNTEKTEEGAMSIKSAPAQKSEEDLSLVCLRPS
jgi:hypothetical protein